MEIEIITTKKKLSKALINQMREPSLKVLQSGTTLGYLIDVRKESHKAVLITHDDEFFIIPANWKKGSIHVYRKIKGPGRWTGTKKFDSESSCNSWWEFYQARMKEAVNQIYV